MSVIQSNKTNFDTKFTETENKFADHDHDKCITTPEFNKLTAEYFAVTLAQAILITKTDFANRLIRLNRKSNSSKTTHLPVVNEFKKLQAFDSTLK